VLEGRFSRVHQLGGIHGQPTAAWGQSKPV
jgi:hypothetical protein